MDRFNTSVFILSTHSVSSGIPLGVILTSDETEKTILCGLETFTIGFTGLFLAKGLPLVLFLTPKVNSFFPFFD